MRSAPRGAGRSVDRGTRGRGIELRKHRFQGADAVANVFLHYVLDQWVDQWRRRYATGDVVIVRYADDFVLGFQHRDEAERFLAELRERLAKFGLELHPEKTRLIEFGRYAAERRKQRSEGKPETFDFLGFTHVCGVTRTNRRFTPRPELGHACSRGAELGHACSLRFLHSRPLAGMAW